MRRKRRALVIFIVAFFVLVYWKQHTVHHTTPSEDTILSKEPEAEELNDRSTTQYSSSKVRKEVKVFIYKLPEKFNVDIQKCVSYDSCFDFRDGGIGRLLYRTEELQVHKTHQFSLEVLLHNKLLHSKYVTHNPEEADLFYIPAYFGIHYFCTKETHDVRQLVEEMFDVVKGLPYFGQGKPHISSLGMIEKELVQDMHPILQNQNYRNITCIVIEKISTAEQMRYTGLENQRVIVAPYPSYVHLDPRLSVKQTISSPSLTSRRVFMFIASSDRRVNEFRNLIVDQFQNSVHDVSFEDFFSSGQQTDSSHPLKVFLVTRECVGQQENYTIDWMQNSVFCLQPHGDSPTRKSFYDSILSGCIPVIFKFHTENVEYPFERVLNYSDFVVTIDAQRIVTNKELVLDILKTIPNLEVQRLHNNIRKVAHKLQYSIIVNQDNRHEDSSYVDALDMIIDEASHVFGL